MSSATTATTGTHVDAPTGSRRRGSGSVRGRSRRISGSRFDSSVIVCSVLPQLFLVVCGLFGSGLRLGHERFNVEVIKTRLNAFACARPFLLGHMGRGIPHLLAVVDSDVMRVLLGLRTARR